LIELLVVIAIIGILSSVVLASLNTARDKGKDASAKGSISAVRAQAEISYDDNSNSYSSVCSDVDTLLTAAEAQTATDADFCSATTNTYSAGVVLNDGTIFCVDSSGFAGATTTEPTGGALCD
jgi:type II secretory pathway pseudopilin PulG